jgi:hypothetical protein
MSDAIAPGVQEGAMDPTTNLVRIGNDGSEPELRHRFCAHRNATLCWPRPIRERPHKARSLGTGSCPFISRTPRRIDVKRLSSSGVTCITASAIRAPRRFTSYLAGEELNLLPSREGQTINSRENSRRTTTTSAFHWSRNSCAVQP